MSQLNLLRGLQSKSYRCLCGADRRTHTSSKVIWHKLPESHHFLPPSEWDLQLIPLTGSWTSNKTPREPMGPTRDAPIYPPSEPVLLRRLTMQIRTGGREILTTHLHTCICKRADMEGTQRLSFIRRERGINQSLDEGKRSLEVSLNAPGRKCMEKDDATVRSRNLPVSWCIW